MNETIAVLGSEGTFSDSAAHLYSKIHHLPLTEVFFPTFEDTFEAVGKTCAYGILPIENTLDGHVQRTLDLLLRCHERGIRVVDEITVPVRFSLVGNVSSIQEIKRIYVQFKANGQCRTIMRQLPEDVRIVETENNVESFEKVSQGRAGEAAIIPHHLFETSDFPFGIENVTDHDQNFTRFFIFHREERSIFELNGQGTVKALLYFLPENEDKPGLLFDFLKEFSLRKINLVSIMSRPTKRCIGTYHFYMEINAPANDLPLLRDTFIELKTRYAIQLMGIYFG